MKVLITGASSYVGAGIYAFLKEKFEVSGTYFSNKLFPELIKMDITDSNSVKKVIENTKPDIIVHAAANPNAVWCEEHKPEAIELNETGTRNIVEAANSINAKIIYISSYAAVFNQSTVYGKTKFDGEKIVKKAKAGWAILQPSLIIGYSPNTTNDRPFNRILKNITEKTPAIHDTSWKFQPSWLDHISETIEQIIKRKIYGETIPIAIPELKTRFDLAKDILNKFNIETKPIDKKDSSPVFDLPQDKIKELQLPIYSYKEMIDKIVKDIKEKTQ